jgi:hypothetical protein
MVDEFSCLGGVQVEASEAEAVAHQRFPSLFFNSLPLFERCVARCSISDGDFVPGEDLWGLDDGDVALRSGRKDDDEETGDEDRGKDEALGRNATLVLRSLPIAGFHCMQLWRRSSIPFF